MSNIKITKGDMPKGQWSYFSKELKKSGLNTYRIPIHDIVSITQLNAIGKNIYIRADLATGQKFQASMTERAFSIFQEDFLSEGNKPKNNILPIKKSNDDAKGYLAIAFLMVFLFLFNRDGDETEILASDKEEVCKHYIAAVMYKSPSIMRSSLITKDSAHFFKVSYSRSSDNKRWEYVCHIDDSKVVWAALDNGQTGRFRYEEDSRYKVKRTENGKKASISIPGIGQVNFNL